MSTASRMPPVTRSRPWADLPVELVDEVLARLDVFSATLFAAVCAPWARAVAATKTPLPFGKPCLLAPSVDVDRADDDRCCVLDLTDIGAGDDGGEPPRRDRFWVGGKDAWLATIDERCNLQLLNPYTGDRVDLPAVSTIPGVEPSGRRYGIRHLGCADAFRKVVVCETPSSSAAAAGGNLAIAIVAGRVLAVARGGDRSWTPLNNHRDMWAGYDDAVMHRGNVFAVDADGTVFSWDLTVRAVAGTCPYPRRLQAPWHGLTRESVYQYNLSESGDGRRLVAVCTHGKYVKVEKPSHSKSTGATVDRFHADGMHVMELDVDDDRRWRWRRVTGLGDRALLLGVSWPIWATVVSRGPPGQLLQPNCVYVAPAVLFGFPDEDFDVVVYDLSDKSCRHVKVCTGDREDGFAIPIWFTPTLQMWNRRAS